MKCLTLPLLCALSIACASVPDVVNVPDDLGAEVDAAAPVDAAVPEFDAGDASPPLGCPVVAPGFGTACTKRGSVCLYGNSPDPGCRQEVECTDKGKWDFSNYYGSCGWIKCPSAKPSATDRCTEAVTTQGGCWWSDGTYCACGYEGPWKCYAPTTTPGCPATFPNEGSACAKEGLSCAYCETRTAVCERGAWETEHRSGRVCPMP
jgi:hypothetical protein